MTYEEIIYRVIAAPAKELPAKPLPPVERPFCPHCGAYHERHAAEYPSHGLA